MASQSSHDLPQDQSRHSQNGSQRQRHRSSSKSNFALNCSNQVASAQGSDSNNLVADVKHSRIRTKQITSSSEYSVVEESVANQQAPRTHDNEDEYDGGGDDEMQLPIGTQVKIYSASLGGWIPGSVIAPERTGISTVEVLHHGKRFRKNVLASSPDCIVEKLIDSGSQTTPYESGIGLRGKSHPRDNHCQQEAEGVPSPRSLSVVATVGYPDRWSPHPKWSNLDFRVLQNLRDERKAHKAELEEERKAHKAELEEYRSKLAELGHPNALSKASVASALSRKGFSVHQLLEFYRQKINDGRITTNDVVKTIVLPETAGTQTCYMESEFMRALGGPQFATKLVSHAWKSPFLNTVLNIVLDAWGKGVEHLVQYMGSWPHDMQSDKFDAASLLKQLTEKEPAVLSKTYWLCVFAVNEHRNICGDCFDCRLKDGAADWSSSDFAADPCRFCLKPKYNPCPCGSLKTPKSDPQYEIDKFDEVVELMPGGLVVSMDPELVTVRRVWVVAEIAEAMQHKTVQFQLARGLSTQATYNLRREEPIVPEVKDCEYTAKHDYDMILRKVREKSGGEKAFNEFVWTLVEVQFGRFHRLSQLSLEASLALRKINTLHINYSWDKSEEFTQIPPWGNTENLAHLQQVHILSMSCKCLTSIDELGRALGQCRALTTATFNFQGCPLTSIDELGKGLGQCKALRTAKFDFAGCPLTSIDELGKGLGQCKALKTANFIFWGCFALTSIDEFGKGLGQCQSLTTATFNFDSCCNLASIDEFGKGLGQCQSLTTANFYFYECRALASIDGLGGLGQCQSLTTATFDFRWCLKLPQCLQTKFASLAELCSTLEDASEKSPGFVA